MLIETGWQRAHTNTDTHINIHTSARTGIYVCTRTHTPTSMTDRQAGRHTLNHTHTITPNRECNRTPGGRYRLILNRWASSVFTVASTCATMTPVRSISITAASCRSVVARLRQWPHHGAENLTSHRPVVHASDSEARGGPDSLHPGYRSMRGVGSRASLNDQPQEGGPAKRLENVHWLGKKSFHLTPHRGPPSGTGSAQG